jgi:hypothetical protein
MSANVLDIDITINEHLFANKMIVDCIMLSPSTKNRVQEQEHQGFTPQSWSKE